jgi:hypothetical protein
MKNKHFVFFDNNSKDKMEALRRRLVACGMPESADDREMFCFSVTDDQANWPCLMQVFADYPLYTAITDSIFTSEELLRAEWMAARANWVSEFPQPSNDFEDWTYDQTQMCPKCHTGKRQDRPFRMNAEVKWKRRYVKQLYWAWDALFVRPDIWRAVFEPLGIRCWPVLKKRTDQVLESVVQLRIEHVLPGPLRYLDRYPHEDCPVCGVRRYDPIRAGYFPPLSVSPPAGVHLAFTQEWFGSGIESYPYILFSHELYTRLLSLGLHDLHLLPAATDEQGLNPQSFTYGERGQSLV